MLQCHLSMIETLFLSIVILLVGRWLRRRVAFLEKFFIPSPVIGGVLFSFILLIGYVTHSFELSFDSQLKDLVMIGFFTTIGFSASAETLRQGGKSVGIFLLVVVLMLILQNVTAAGLAMIFGLSPLLGLAMGSLSMSGGHGTAAAFAPILEQAGVSDALSVSIAAATFGLIAGSLIGGPVGKMLLRRYNLITPKSSAKPKINKIIDFNERTLSECKDVTENSLFNAFFIIITAMGIGSYITPYVQGQSFTLPAYLIPMLTAAVMRNIADFMKLEIPMEEVKIIGNLSLLVFLSMALMGLRLWDLYALALPMFIILMSQVIVMALFAYFVTFRIMGKNYDAAVLATGHCGFALGATPNAMANMEAFTEANGYSQKAFFVVPLVGSLFVDFFNAAIITTFINLFK